jgi:hypothetical protein
LLHQEIEGIYYISQGEKEFAPDYEYAKRVADERGLPLIERDISKYRTQNGLEPITEKGKRELCRNVLRKCCEGDKDLEVLYNQFSVQFVNNNFQEFFEKFMQLKINLQFSKEDILRIFSDIVKGDLNFSKIAQDIDERQELTKRLIDQIELYEAQSDEVSKFNNGIEGLENLAYQYKIEKTEKNR